MKTLTQDNYYDDKDYMSVSRFKQYLECEAKALALDTGKWIDERDRKPLVFGNYVHSYFESAEAHQKFLEEHKSDLFSSRKPYGLLADYKLADKVIATLETDELFNNLYHGRKGDRVEKEMIVTGTITGVPFKGKIDSINHTRNYMVDLKTMKTIYGEEWCQELKRKVPGAIANIINYHYHVQTAVYRELLKQMTGRSYKPLIVAVSKENEPDKEILSLDEETLSEGLEFVSERAGHVWDVATGKVGPIKCGNCNYCRSKKKLNRIVSIRELLEM
ncbi:TPA: PD-(D/E)XK nuclease-like domain-containing protein [Streptococcus suis]|uniref:Putative exodeoxyribonuclease 8 PDDEXK-like domain-containing protein n=1 Tax=Streptococcus suis TaxID=1307 RepID=A0AB37G8M1_STRSU|nr:PD-(D/E)XK nuclease-like domain-containing protein [Streptococcus suis]MCB2854200.1 PD-(D/E)XK nuclease-like domain-containing protein [Streptococcus suis]MCB2913702.1 PD-(D/E)XK nuclease-like domain-containing protein [Streptococcus suis]MCB2917481.1 PD-(D/E)XK nuclease-like domain-containing protein [Streptococcus suis]MCB2919520.1 PD-(D/E)XK nuclease-like domain-containing protein [Streptococcus suis]MCB2923924.1 PD-(D/E)XK nuclease-like domain-containing protein [Streptococcus suis]